MVARVVSIFKLVPILAIAVVLVSELVTLEPVTSRVGLGHSWVRTSTAAELERVGPDIRWTIIVATSGAGRTVPRAKVIVPSAATRGHTVVAIPTSAIAIYRVARTVIARLNHLTVRAHVRHLRLTVVHGLGGSRRRIAVGYHPTDRA